MTGLKALFAAWQLFPRRPGAVSEFDNLVEATRNFFAEPIRPANLLAPHQHRAERYSRDAQPCPDKPDPGYLLLSDLDNVAVGHVAPITTGQ